MSRQREKEAGAGKLRRAGLGQWSGGQTGEQRATAEQTRGGQVWDDTFRSGNFSLGGGDWRGRPKRRLESGKEAEGGREPKPHR